jgi:uncharacterized protein YqhQ
MSDIGGQAVIEGVMMRNKNKVATAVRLPNKKIKIKKQRLKPRSKFLKLFFIRGIINLIDMLTLGIKTLMWSADQQTGEEEKISKTEITITVILSLAFGIGLFLFLPYLFTYLLGFKELINPLLFNIIYGTIKAGMLVLYLYLISFMKDIRRVFQYHGAEHKVVFCYENKKSLTPENIKKFITAHPRCGTSFLIIVILVSVILFSFIPLIVQNIYPAINSIHWLLRRVILFACRLLLLPVVAGFSYEILKFGAKHQDNIIFRALTLPGLWVQKLTTKEPTKKQIEVATRALKSVL